MINKAIFYAAAACTFIAGILHLAIVPMFFTQLSLDVMIFFIVSGLAQVFWVIPIIKKWSNIWYYFGIGGTVVLIIMYLVAVPGSGYPVSPLDIAIELSNCFHNFLHCYNYERQKKNSKIGQKIRLISIT